jgi:hypothetical protein
MLDGCSRLQREIGYNPTRFRQMVADHGGVEAAKRLLQGPTTSDGFSTLWEAGRLHLSVEAFVLLPRFSELFTDSERAEARRRLDAHQFEVQRFLDQVGDDLP